jgi:hypothetical protein
MDCCKTTDCGIYKKEKYFTNLFTNVVNGIISSRIDEAKRKMKRSYFPRYSMSEFADNYGISDMKDSVDKYFIKQHGIDLSKMEQEELDDYLFGDLTKDFRVWSYAVDVSFIATCELLYYGKNLYITCHRYRIENDGTTNHIENFNSKLDETTFGINMHGKFTDENAAFEKALSDKQRMDEECIEIYEMVLKSYAEVEKMVYKDAINEIRSYKRDSRQYIGFKEQVELLRADIKGLELCGKEINRNN